MDREEFMAVVYDLLADDPDNNRANEIIEAADEYAEDAAKEALEVDAIPIDWMEKRIEYYKGLNCWYTAKLAILEWRAKQEGRYVPRD